MLFDLLPTSGVAPLIWDVYPGSDFFHPGSMVKKIPDPGSESAPRIEVFFTQKIGSIPYSPKYDPGCSSRIRILIFYPSRIQGSKMHRIRNTNSYIINQRMSKRYTWSLTYINIQKEIGSLTPMGRCNCYTTLLRNEENRQTDEG
jgi:hypothetical protein